MPFADERQIRQEQLANQGAPQPGRARGRRVVLPRGGAPAAPPPAHAPPPPPAPPPAPLPVSVDSRIRQRARDHPVVHVVRTRLEAWDDPDAGVTEEDERDKTADPEPPRSLAGQEFNPDFVPKGSKQLVQRRQIVAELHALHLIGLDRSDPDAARAQELACKEAKEYIDRLPPYQRHREASLPLSRRLPLSKFEFFHFCRWAYEHDGPTGLVDQALAIFRSGTTEFTKVALPNVVRMASTLKVAVKENSPITEPVKSSLADVLAKVDPLSWVRLQNPAPHGIIYRFGLKHPDSAPEQPHLMTLIGASKKQFESYVASLPAVERDFLASDEPFATNDVEADSRAGYGDEHDAFKDGFAPCYHLKVGMARRSTDGKTWVVHAASSVVSTGRRYDSFTVDASGRFGDFKTGGIELYADALVQASNFGTIPIIVYSRSYIDTRYALSAFVEAKYYNHARNGTPRELVGAVPSGSPHVHLEVQGRKFAVRFIDAGPRIVSNLDKRIIHAPTIGLASLHEYFLSVPAVGTVSFEDDVAAREFLVYPPYRSALAAASEVGHALTAATRERVRKCGLDIWQTQHVVESIRRILAAKMANENLSAKLDVYCPPPPLPSEEMVHLDLWGAPSVKDRAAALAAVVASEAASSVARTRDRTAINPTAEQQQLYAQFVETAASTAKRYCDTYGFDPAQFGVGKEEDEDDLLIEPDTEEDEDDLLVEPDTEEDEDDLLVEPDTEED
ncbi:hypothetical protein JCM3775_003672 [Rhodotorula graminis]